MADKIHKGKVKSIAPDHEEPDGMIYIVMLEGVEKAVYSSDKFEPGEEIEFTSKQGANKNTLITRHRVTVTEEPKEPEAPPPANKEVVRRAPEPPWKIALRTAEAKFLAVTGIENQAKIELGFAVQLMEENPKLKECTPDSIVNSIVNVARMGTTLNPALRLCHLVPRYNSKKKALECKAQPDYKGLVKVLKDNGCLKFFDAIIVYSDERYIPNMAPNEAPIHERNFPKTEKDQRSREVVGLYGRVVLPDGTVIYTDLMPFWEIQKALAVAETDYVHKAWPEEMWKKTKLRRDFKLLISGNADEKIIATMEADGDETFPTNPIDRETISNLIEQIRGAGITGNDALVKKIWNDNPKYHSNMDFVNANAEAWEAISELKKQNNETAA